MFMRGSIGSMVRGTCSDLEYLRWNNIKREASPQSKCFRIVGLHYCIEPTTGKKVINHTGSKTPPPQYPRTQFQLPTLPRQACLIKNYIWNSNSRATVMAGYYLLLQSRERNIALCLGSWQFMHWSHTSCSYWTKSLAGSWHNDTRTTLSKGKISKIQLTSGDGSSILIRINSWTSLIIDIFIDLQTHQFFNIYITDTSHRNAYSIETFPLLIASFSTSSSCLSWPSSVWIQASPYPLQLFLPFLHSSSLFDW